MTPEPDASVETIRVAQISPYSAEQLSGINRLIGDLSMALRTRAIWMELICPGEGPSSVLANMQVVAIRVSGRHVRNLRLAVRTAVEIARRRNEIDLIHVHQPHAQSFAALLIGRVLSKPTLITLHVRVPHRSPLARAATRLWTAACLGQAGRTVAVSEKTLQDYGVKDGMVIANGVGIAGCEGETLNHGHAGRRIVFAGRIARTKGIYELLEALATVVSSHPDTRLVTFGTPENPGEYEAAKARAGVQRLVEDRGFIPGWREELHREDVFVLPSFYEGMPLSMLEAMGSGLLVIATPVGGIPEVVEDGRSGLLVPPGDSKALADAVRWVFNHPVESMKIRRKGWETVAARHSLESMAAEYEQLYRSELATRIPRFASDPVVEDRSLRGGRA
ncbi:MAG TPA: glycosyltransferase family 4 protein [Thermoplasmata archaeon]|nr:glycosyltransferase family 4 protein [Thermoplasmata archaeon]